MLKTLIDRNIKKELTLDVVSDLCYNKFTVRIDNKLGHMDLQECIANKGIIILLLNDTSLSGHYVSITVDDRRHGISFFCPYGFHPSTLSEVAGSEVMNFLVKLQAMLNYKLDINTRQLQNVKSSVQTCGRYTAIRALCYKLNNNEFNELLDETITLNSPDKLITLMTLARDMYVPVETSNLF